ncbi:HD-GYP domain-containing protein [Sinanaerobacter sp. ZZT-01]|uniref:HD-GYP domain-containing protein n=1 Tax=Sinanaerobacter sp. ZZT-01 TaxID=3111540 RepID=UPI002D771DED|nr:HD domain-containing phosphohydrolase [Sinanaerobacter sp. ZZT-01]WRR93031.1 HD domain-containing phosphohydrolase [Sinanaerobacter sp. ZZT-01]
MDKIKINLKDFLLCISDAQDLMSPTLSKHHQQVAYLAFRLAERLGLSIERQKNIILASLVHDIGALSKKERLEIIETETMQVNNHAFIGAKLLGEFKPLEEAARIIKFHHIAWNYGEGQNYKGEEVPFESHIIHLADRTCTFLYAEKNVISNLPNIIQKIKKNTGIVFESSLVDALEELSKYEYIWLDLMATTPMEMINDFSFFDTLLLEIDDVMSLSYIFSQIIDFRSEFTARHSAGVAKTAEQLARLIGFSTYECKMMLIAGYLHDLGKIAINNSILEKNGKLNEGEFNEIRMHTYYTYRLLERIPQFNEINKWASYHHEKLDGTGYPFHIKGENIPLGSRIMAVADVFTAIKEDRPYRLGMQNEAAIHILRKMVKNNALDEKVVRVLIENFEDINNIRDSFQKAAAKRYNDFCAFK